MNKKEAYKKYIYLSAVIVALGITFTTTMKDSMGSLGLVFVAVGGLFFIIGMSKKRKIDEESDL